MRVPRLDSAKEARERSVIIIFRDILQTRMLWVASGLVAVGMVSAFWLTNPNFHPVLNQLPSDNAGKNISTDQTSTPAMEPLSENPAAELSTQPPANSMTSKNVAVATVESKKKSTRSAGQKAEGATSTCDQAAKKVAEQERQSKIQAEKKRHKSASGLQSLVGSITGGLFGPTTTEEYRRYQAELQRIEATYQQALTAAGCKTS